MEAKHNLNPTTENLKQWAKTTLIKVGFTLNSVVLEHQDSLSGESSEFRFKPVCEHRCLFFKLLVLL